MDFKALRNELRRLLENAGLPPEESDILGRRFCFHAEDNIDRPYVLIGTITGVGYHNSGLQIFVGSTLLGLRTLLFFEGGRQPGDFVARLAQDSPSPLPCPKEEQQRWIDSQYVKGKLELLPQ